MKEVIFLNEDYVMFQREIIIWHNISKVAMSLLSYMIQLVLFF